MKICEVSNRIADEERHNYLFTNSFRGMRKRGAKAKKLNLLKIFSLIPIPHFFVFFVWSGNV